ncbi:MAG: hypothetical protein SXV54_25570 [Chloroflexota bacterium]|nr:hypothetical protein [Chloroflexota bacterium]
MPASKTRLELDRTFSAEEYQRISMGLTPEQMEDKWFIYLKDNWLHLHRSWTGVCIYQLRLEPIGNDHRIAEAWGNRDPDQYRGADDEYDALLLAFLIDRLLLGKNVPFPAPDNLPSQDLEAVHRHHVVGYSRANDESVYT